MVPPEQRDLLRFLWWKEGEDKMVPYRLKVHLFGATSSPSIANFALRRAAEEAYKKGQVEVEVYKSVQRNFYVDDCLKSMKEETEAIRMAHDLVKACAYGGFRLTKFVSTSTKLLRSFPPSEVANIDSIALYDDKQDPLGSMQERALGVMWNLRLDCFQFNVTMKPEENLVTKRMLLSKLSAIYDPLGMAAPVIIVGRMLFRELSVDKRGWDEKVNTEEQAKWMTWTKQLVHLQQVQVPRCVNIEKCLKTRLQLHVFCDASANAYAAVAYLRKESSEGAAPHISFVLGKARVTPPKVITIPRLELTAAKLAVEMAELVGREMEVQIEQRFFWSDSTTVLKYLRNKERRFQVFVANRVNTILSVSEVEEWRYVPTDHNPSDAGTRGLDAVHLGNSSWLRGPRFLMEREEKWPQIPETPLLEGDPELKRQSQVAATRMQGISELNIVEQLSAKHSSAFQVRRAVAVWLRVKAKLLQTETINKQSIGVKELRKADEAAIISLQRLKWANEISLLLEQAPLPKRSQLYKLHPHIRQGEAEIIVMRSRTRVELPIVPRGPYAKLLVQEAHEQQGHQGRGLTGAWTQKRYWIVGLNKLVREVVKQCPACQRRLTRPQPTIMAPLPEYRHRARCRPFEVTGVDYFGPFHTKRGRGTCKAYGVIFTCATTRAVHLEVSEDLSSSSFVNALRRFIARRGHVRRFVSDNGTNFVGAQDMIGTQLSNELKRQACQQPFNKRLKDKGIEWTFNTPGASHHGGFWERLIQSVRRILEALLQRGSFTLEVLTTLLCECEAVLNNRPLTPISDDPEDYEALTPNHLLMGVAYSCDSSTCLPGDFGSISNGLKEQWKLVQYMANDFWRRWCSEYKSLLHLQAKWHKKTRRPLQVDDPVLVVDQLKPRDQWKLGRVTQVHSSPLDGEVRSIDVKTANGVLTRPISKICLLEAASANASTGN